MELARESGGLSRALAEFGSEPRCSGEGSGEQFHPLLHCSQSGALEASLLMTQPGILAGEPNFVSFLRNDSLCLQESSGTASRRRRLR